jgi:hypothetical protein
MAIPAPLPKPFSQGGRFGADTWPISPESAPANNPTTSTVSYPEPPTEYRGGNIPTVIASGGAYVTAKIMSITQQQAGYPWKAEVLIQSFIEMAGLSNPVKDAKGKIITVYANQDMGSFKATDVVTAKIRRVFNLPNRGGDIVNYIENVVLE